MRRMKYIYIFALLLNIKNSYSQDYFNPLFLGSDIDSIEDLSYLTEGNNITPGKYFLNLYISDSFIKNINIEFKKENDNKVKACFKTDILDLIPFNKETEVVLSKLIDKSDKSKCIEFGDFIKDFDYSIDLSRLELTLSIPQIYLKKTRSTLANESDWDNGISALITNYNLNGSVIKNKKTDDYSSIFLNLNNRLNVGAWRLTSNLYYNRNKINSSSQQEWKSTNTFITRNINSIKSIFIAGQNTLGSMLFDSNPYIGFTLATANEMLPDSERGYSPTIKGIAESRSKLTIKQNGNIVYQEYINPGPYNIDNLNSVGTSGDYEVELTSADGVTTKYIVPYSSIPNLLRMGSYNYSVTLGELDILSTKRKKFTQGTIGLGLPLDSTIYSGYQISNDYLAAGLGLAKDIGKFGALSVDTIQAKTKIYDKIYNGSSYRILYAKSFNDLGTNIQLTGYRYSTSDYYTFSESSYKNNYNANLDEDLLNTNIERKKNSFQVNLSQNLGDYGQLYFWGNINSYWGSESKSKNIQIGWNKTLTDLNNVIISASYSKNTYTTNTDNIIYLSISVPLSSPMNANKMYITNSFNYNNSTYNNLTSIYGSELENRLDYNLYKTINNNPNADDKSNLNLRYKANVTEVNMGTSYSNNSKELDYGATGSILLHQNGILLAREANDTAILVEAKGATGAKLDNSGENISINNNGYALIPYATAYHYNDVGISPETFGSDYDIDGKIVKVAPTRGAISKVVFDVRKGYRFLVSLNYKDKPLKFGTFVVSDDDKTTSIVNDDSTVYLTGVKPNSSYTVKLDKDTECKFIINYAPDLALSGVNKINSICK
ncbi:fimbria/pilus outer membrane usher protein [Providencia manganoxydans]|uniref:fimbria/pilus outer membrane usher protein n=1 Tax=Providencia manganoxydans TaxID=2923283 RepID=UPI0034E3E023